MLHPHKRTAGSHQANNIAVHAILEVTAQLAPRPSTFEGFSDRR
jgi:hypothetical protein